MCCCCCLGCTRDVSAAMQIGIIVLNSFSFVLILLCLIFISWDELNTASLVLFIINFNCLNVIIIHIQKIDVNNNRHLFNSFHFS